MAATRSSMVIASLVYLHSTDERKREIAASLGQLA
jgi:hypothetical protein